jgi:hypothetical protein
MSKAIVIGVLIASLSTASALAQHRRHGHMHRLMVMMNGRLMPLMVMVNGQMVPVMVEDDSANGS